MEHQYLGNGLCPLSLNIIILWMNSLIGTPNLWALLSEFVEKEDMGDLQPESYRRVGCSEAIGSNKTNTEKNRFIYLKSMSNNIIP
jgi:hypothetical protein